WGRYQQRLVAAIAPLSVEQLALRTTPRHWSIGMYATHIVANRAWWFHARMGEGSDDLTSLELWALGVCEADVDPGHPAAELVAGLETTWHMIEETLARLSPADLERVVPPLTAADRVRHAHLVEPALQPYAQMWVDGTRLAGDVRPAVARPMDPAAGPGAPRRKAKSSRLSAWRASVGGTTGARRTARSTVSRLSPSVSLPRWRRSRLPALPPRRKPTSSTNRVSRSVR